MNRIALCTVCDACAVVPVVVMASQPSERSGNSIQNALDRAIDDERPKQPVCFTDRSGRLGTLTSIRLASLCFQGRVSNDDIAPANRRALSLWYESEQSTVFSECDLHGWFWVEVP